MVAVRGYTKMLLDEKEGPLTALQREYLTIVLENSKKVIQLLNDAERLGRKERP
jgi:signal transduction histidine kinase